MRWFYLAVDLLCARVSGKPPDMQDWLCIFLFSDHEKTSEWGDAGVEKGEEVDCTLKANVMRLFFLMSLFIYSLGISRFDNLLEFFINMESNLLKNCIWESPNGWIKLFYLSSTTCFVCHIEMDSLLNPFIIKEVPVFCLVFFWSCRLSGFLA